MNNSAKPLAIVFSDICASTTLFERFGDAYARSIESVALHVMGSTVQKFGGWVVNEIGDEVLSAFEDCNSAVLACIAMHSAVAEHRLLFENDIYIRIGVHWGEALVEGDNIFGDSVNVAARMVSLSKAGQIITNEYAVERLDAKRVGKVRYLGETKVKGKTEDFKIYEVLSGQDTQDLTVASMVKAISRDVHLRLQWREDEFTIDHKNNHISIGRGEDNSLVIPRQFVSRSHAAIECRKGKFFLVDYSTNGSRVLLSSGAQMYVHREEINLTGQGAISLGTEMTEGEYLHFNIGGMPQLVGRKSQ